MAAFECRAASRRLNTPWVYKGLSAGARASNSRRGVNVGSSDRIDCTAVGDNVNIAARLE
jgi:adenylate cyclase